MTTPMTAEARYATLTPKEIDTLVLVTQGMNNKQIAKEIGVSAGAVDYCLRGLFAKLNVENRTQATIWYLAFKERKLAA